MQSLPPAGSPYSDGPLWSGRASAPAAAAASQDRVELAGAPPAPLLKPGSGRAASSPAHESPRPWPPALSDLPRSSAWSALGSQGQAAAAAGALFQGPLGPALLPALEGQPGSPPPDPWEATATPNGWRVPRNPSRTPVRPRDPFEIQSGTEDLGPLRLVSSASGRIRALRLQWPEEFQEPAFSAQKAVFHDLFTRLAADVTMHVVAEGLGAAALPGMLSEWSIAEPSRIHIHPMHLHSTPELLDSPMTMWARDGALLAKNREGGSVLLLPRSFRGDGEVDAKLNRLQVQGSGAAPARLEQLVPELTVRRSSLLFEGGDVIASRRAVLLGGQNVTRTMAALRLSREAVLERFSELFGLPVLVIDPQPEFHLDLGFTFLDEDTIAVADPGESMRMVAGMAELEPLVRATREKQLAERYDRAALWLGQNGYRVVRLPNLCGLGLTTPYLTYNNVLLENYVQEGQRVKKVYLPVYAVPLLDEAARNSFRQHGYQVVDMPSARQSTKLWGAIRCATGELQVSDA